MSYILYVPELNGHKSLENQSALPPPGTNYHAVYDTAKTLSIPCYRAIFQTAARPFPTLTEMGETVATEIQRLQDAHGEAGLIVASGVGAGVALQALTLMEPEYALPHMIAYKPVLDPLHAITTILSTTPAGQSDLQQLEKGDITTLKLPVETIAACSDPGHFMLTQDHINDPGALRLLSNPTDSLVHFSNSLAGRKMASLKLIVAENDHLASTNIGAFARAIGHYARGSCTLSIIPGTHGDDHSKRLAQETHNLAFRMLY